MKAWGSPESLEQHLREIRVLDPDGIHHEFAGGDHGKKADLGPEVVLRKGPVSRVYEEMVEANSRVVRTMVAGEFLGTVILMGIANGAVDLAQDIASNIGGGVRAIATIKTPEKRVILPDEVLDEFRGKNQRPAAKLHVIGVDDLGTTGGTMLPPMEQLRGVGVERLEALYTWLRNLELQRLKAAGIPVTGVIDNSPIATYPPPPDCLHCQEGDILIRY